MPETYTREDLARAYDAGVRDMARALQGGNEPVNPYRDEPPSTEPPPIGSVTIGTNWYDRFATGTNHNLLYTYSKPYLREINPEDYDR